MLNLGFIPPTLAAARAAFGGAKKSQEFSAEVLGYDFIGLIMKLVVYFTIAWFADKYVKYIINPTAPSIIVSIFGALGGLPIFALAAWIKSLFESQVTAPTEGKLPFKYWDIIKGGAIMLVIWEWSRYKNSQEALGGATSPMTNGIFMALLGLLSLMTIPDVVQKLKEMQIIK